jgi:hypothetical protein
MLLNPGIPWKFINGLELLAGSSNFVGKKMNTNNILAILESEDLLERFVEVLIEEINNDEEALYKKGRELLNFCLSNDHADDFFIAICGWSVDSLLSRVCK